LLHFKKAVLVSCHLRQGTEFQAVRPEMKNACSARLAFWVLEKEKR